MYVKRIQLWLEFMDLQVLKIVLNMATKYIIKGDIKSDLTIIGVKNSSNDILYSTFMKI